MTLELHELSVSLGGSRILEGCSLSARPGELIGLIGPNGAGKTTLLRCAAGLLQADSGAVSLAGTALARLPARQRARRMAYLAQSGGVHWPLTVRRIVALGRLPHLEPWRALQAGDARVVDEAMRRLDVANLGARVFHTLSGGERMRTMLARALAGEPELLLADEPLAGLDPYHQLQVMALLAELAGDGRAVVAVLHDLSLAGRYCHRLALMDAGRIVACGPAAEVLTAERVAAVYRVSTWIDGRADERRLTPRERLD